jgi:hypothetical protein
MPHIVLAHSPQVEMLAIIRGFEEWRHYLEGACHPNQVLTRVVHGYGFTCGLTVTGHVGMGAGPEFHTCGIPCT